MIVTDANKLIEMERMIAIAISENKIPIKLFINIIGKNTMIVVNVADKIDPATLEVPSTEDSKIDFLFVRLRSIEENTTLLVSNNIPMPKANPPKDIMFKEI